MEEEEQIWNDEEEIENVKERKMTSLTRLSEDEEEEMEGSLSEDNLEKKSQESEERSQQMVQQESEEKYQEKDKQEPPQKAEMTPSVDSKPNTSDLLVLGSDGKLRKAKPAVSLVDLFKQAREKKIRSQSESQAKEETLFEKEEENEQEDEASIPEDEPPSDESAPEDENDYTEQPTAEDYARYKEMMKEPTHVHNDLLDSEAEESGDDIPLEGELEEKEDGKIVIPNGIDIVERAVTEKERRDLLSLHHRMKEQEDEEQLAYVKKGIREGPAYMRSRN